MHCSKKETPKTTLSLPWSGGPKTYLLSQCDAVFAFVPGHWEPRHHSPRAHGGLHGDEQKYVDHEVQDALASNIISRDECAPQTVPTVGWSSIKTVSPQSARERVRVSLSSEFTSSAQRACPQQTPYQVLLSGLSLQAPSKYGLDPDSLGTASPPSFFHFFLRKITTYECAMNDHGVLGRPVILLRPTVLLQWPGMTEHA